MLVTKVNKMQKTIEILEKITDDIKEQIKLPF